MPRRRHGVRRRVRGVWRLIRSVLAIVAIAGRVGRNRIRGGGACRSCVFAWLILFRRPRYDAAAVPQGRSWLWYAVPSAVALVAACVAIERYHAAAWSFGGVMGMLLGGAASGALLVSPPWLARTPAQCRAVGRSRVLAAPACALAFLLLAAGSWFSGQMMLATGGPDNGLFVVDYLNERDADYLRDRYPNAMADAVALAAPDESDHLARAASPLYYDYVVQRGVDDFDCDPTDGTINESAVMLSTPARRWPAKPNPTRRPRMTPRASS